MFPEQLYTAYSQPAHPPSSTHDSTASQIKLESLLCCQLFLKSWLCQSPCTNTALNYGDIVLQAYNIEYEFLTNIKNSMMKFVLKCYDLHHCKQTKCKRCKTQILIIHYTCHSITVTFIQQPNCYETLIYQNNFI